MKWWQRLSVRIPVLVFMLSLAPMVIFGTNAILKGRSELMEMIRQSNSLALLHAVHEAEVIVRQTQRQMVLAAEMAEIDTLGELDQQFALQMLQKQIPELRDLAVLNADGMETARVSTEKIYRQGELVSRAQTPAFRNAIQGEPFTGAVRVTETGTQRLTIAVPITDPVAHRVSAVLVAEASIRKLLSEITSIPVGSSGFVYILDDQGHLIAHPDQSMVQTGVNFRGHKHFQHILEGHPEAVEALHRHLNPSGKDVLSMGRQSKFLGWVFMTEHPADEALSMVSAMERRLGIWLAVISCLVGIGALFVIFRLARPLRRLETAANNISRGSLDQRVIVDSTDEIGAVAAAFNTMAERLVAADAERRHQDWLKTGRVELEESMRGDQPLDQLCRKIVTRTSKYLGAQVGALYVSDGGDRFSLTGSYAYQVRKHLMTSFGLGEGVVGQAALERQHIILTEVPDDYVTIRSGLGETPPRHIVVMPLVYNEEVTGVIEIGTMAPLTDIQLEFLSESSQAVAVAIHSARSRKQLRTALETTQRQSEELQTQQEELKTANEELEEQALRLRASEEKLKTQQEELQVTNEELEEKSQALEEEKELADQRNAELINIQKELKQKAQELEATSRYKSDFLANMSHELRTPLNSLLILAEDMAENKGDKLDAEQAESANLIYNSGRDLLNLINEILDLAKIEAGHMEVTVEPVQMAEVADSIEKQFRPMSDAKGLTLAVNIEEALPDAITSDKQRLLQILRNLVGNAVKFTDTGGVTISFLRPEPGTRFRRPDLSINRVIGIAVSDTGIGIPDDRRQEIFEAFQQVDSGASRAYGGTGLGLTISRQLAGMLGGEIQLDSRVGAGSTFTLYLPENAGNTRHAPAGSSPAGKPTNAPAPKPPPPVSSIDDDRECFQPEDRVILVIEDDHRFAKVLYRLCHEKGWKCLHAGDGETGLSMVEQYDVDAVILDIRLPGIPGWNVLERLKQNPTTRHIPVHLMTVEQKTLDAFNRGAIGFLQKPVRKEELEAAFARIESIIEREIKNLLVVEDEKTIRDRIIRLIGNSDVVSKAVGTGTDALKELTGNHYDCVILDLTLPDMDGFSVLEQLDRLEDVTVPPVIVYTARDLTREEANRIDRYASTIIIKGVRSEERLLDETALFLHRVIKNLPDQKQQMIAKLYDGDSLFKKKKVLLVDDDMRNAFAIAKILEERGMEVFKAADGQKGLDLLNAEPGMDLVLMDIMMPVMDGYEAMHRIRQNDRFAKLPIIALTAKAMSDDRARCIEAGASDYLPKPVDIDRLLSMMRVWLYK